MNLIYEPHGDQALFIRWPNEATVVRFTQLVRQHTLGWLNEVVPAYTSVSIYLNRTQADVEAVIEWLKQLD